jgi:acyl-CoA reductase-like NAD-dependent aldehyde dehydrogenase
MVFGVGSRAGQALITHPDVNVISFTGSTAVGYHIKKAIAHLPVKLSLEVRKNNLFLLIKKNLFYFMLDGRQKCSNYF